MKPGRAPLSTPKTPITIRLENATIAYFKAMAAEMGMPYQNLINLYLRDCAEHGKKLVLKWMTNG